MIVLTDWIDRFENLVTQAYDLPSCEAKAKITLRLEQARLAVQGMRDELGG